MKLVLICYQISSEKSSDVTHWLHYDHFRKQQQALLDNKILCQFLHREVAAMCDLIALK